MHSLLCKGQYRSKSSAESQIMGADENTAEASAKESTLQVQLQTEKKAMEVRHKSAELLDLASQDHAVIKFGKNAGRKTEYALQIAKESMLNMPGCVPLRKGIITVQAKTAEGLDSVKLQTKKVTG